MKRNSLAKLSDLAIDEVSLVDRAANQYADIVLSKRDEEVDKADPDQSSVTTGDDGEEDVEEELTETEKGYFARLVEKMFGDGQEFTTSDDDTGNIPDMEDVEKVGPGMQLPYGMQPQGMPAPGPQNFMPMQPQAFPGQPGQVQAGPPLPDEVIQYIQQLEQALAAANGGLNKPSGEHEEDDVNPFGKSADAPTDDDDLEFLQELAKNLSDEDTRDAISKALEAVEKANESVAKANERAEEAEKIAKEERDHRLNQEWVAKARAYTNLPMDAEEFGPVLKKLHETLDEDDAALVVKALSTANESVADLRAFEEIGKGSVGGFEVVTKADAEAEEIVKNSSEPISKEAALAQVFSAKPELYEEYLQEKGR